MSRALLVAMLGLLCACAKDKSTPSTQDMANALVSIPETGVPLGVYQRFKYRHDILDSMRANLRALVAAESAYHGDSGKYTNTTSCWVPPTGGTAHWCASRGNTLGAITMSPHGWSTTMTNLNTEISCAIQVGNDTSFGAPAGVPVCFTLKGARSF